ncbi:MAG: hypothetical protein FWD53_13180 [Phycisphaerales bacterium]|nr:hypothetical protein [Phycisphaerales bacterium]
MKFRMVDRITAWEPRRQICGIKTVSFEEYNLRAPFGDEPCLPETLLLESLFQLGNWLIMLSSDFSRMGLLVRWEEMRFDSRLQPGEQLRMQVDVVTYRNDGVQFNGRGLAGDRLVGSGRGCLATFIELEAYHDPADLRVLYSEIGSVDLRSTAKQ